MPINNWLLTCEFVQDNNIIPLTEESVELSANLYAELRKQGKQLDDIDILIAGIAFSNNMKLVTRNSRHFNRVKGLTTIDWSE